MARTYWALKHECATCEYWDGPRRIESDPRVVKCPDDYDQAKGVCQGRSHNRGKRTHASTHCGEQCWVCMRGLKEY